MKKPTIFKKIFIFINFFCLYTFINTPLFGRVERAINTLTPYQKILVVEKKLSLLLEKKRNVEIFKTFYNEILEEKGTIACIKLAILPGPTISEILGFKFEFKTSDCLNILCDHNNIISANRKLKFTVVINRRPSDRVKDIRILLVYSIQESLDVFLQLVTDKISKLNNKLDNLLIDYKLESQSN